MAALTQSPRLPVASFLEKPALLEGTAHGEIVSSGVTADSVSARTQVEHEPREPAERFGAMTFAPAGVGQPNVEQWRGVRQVKRSDDADRVLVVNDPERSCPRTIELSLSYPRTNPGFVNASLGMIWPRVLRHPRDKLLNIVDADFIEPERHGAVRCFSVAAVRATPRAVDARFWK